MAFSSQSSAGSWIGQGRSQSSDRDPPGGAGFGFALGTNAGAAAEIAGLGAAGLGTAGAGTGATGLGLGAGTGTGLGAAGGGGGGGAVVVGGGAVGAVVVGAGVVGAGAGFAFGFSTAGTGAPMRTGDASGASSLRNGLGPVGSVLAGPGPGPGPGPAGFALEVGLPLAANAASSFRRSVRVSDSNVGRTTRDDERAGSSFVRGGDGVDLGASGAGMNVMSEATL